MFNTIVIMRYYHIAKTQFGNYMVLAFDQIVNEAAMNHNHSAIFSTVRTSPLGPNGAASAMGLLFFL